MKNLIDKLQTISDNQARMSRYSTREAAKMLGISHEALANYIRVGKVSPPEAVHHGQRVIHIWSNEQIEHVRKLLPKIANGRKTRYQKKNSAVKAQHSTKHKKKSKPRS